MKVFFTEKMSIESGGYSPSASKPAAVVADWLAHGLAIQICDFEPAMEADLCLAHDPQFVRDVLAGRKTNGHGNAIKEVTQSCLLTVGSLITASRAAFTERIACSPTSGFHHAGFDYNGAFCTFNGLIVAARTAINEGLCSKVAILDCDAHYGDGTHDIIDHLKLHNQIHHWTFGAHWGRGGAFMQQRFLRQINTFLTKAAKAGVGLVIYQAGADPHIDDPLGGYMTSAQMLERDRVVLEKCKELQLAVVINLAGGYNRDSQGTIAPVLALHRATIEEALNVFG
jgi:acetoin utilization deacetylase AcuC-like enzyme